MQRILLLILLLTVVYSWEECKYVFLAIWSKITGHKNNYQKNHENDELVSDIILVATIPLTLAYLLLGNQNLAIKLLVVLAELVLIGLILKGIQEYRERRKFTSHYTGADKISAIIFSLAGLVSPSWRFASDAARSSARISKYLLALALPLAAGVALTFSVHRMGMTELNSKLDMLIVIAVLGLVLNITIEILEKIFHSSRLNLPSLLRIALGIAIIFVIIQT